MTADIPDTKGFSVKRAHLLSVLIGILGAFLGYALVTLTGILLFQDLNEILGDINVDHARAFL